MFSKILAYGFAMPEHAYLKDPWCQLDFVVVCLAWLPIIFPQMGSYSVIRSVRALRPLRALKRMKGMPTLINSLLASLPKLADVGILCGVLVVVMGLGGTSMFKGTMHYRCATPGLEETPDHPSLFDAVNPPKAWANEHGDIADALFQIRRKLKGSGGGASLFGGNQSQFDTLEYCDPLAAVDICTLIDDETSCKYFDDNENYGVMTLDSFGWTVVTVIQALTFDTWTEPMYALNDSTSSGAGVAFYFIIVIIGGFFVVNLFLAVLFEEFVTAEAAEKEAAEEKARKVAQRLEKVRDNYSPGPIVNTQDVSDEMEVAPLVSPDFSNRCDCAPAAGSWRAALVTIVSAQCFGQITTALVVVNMIIMAMPYYGMSDEYAARLENYATIISWCFIVEMGLKILGHGCSGYWSDGWNQLDGTIVSMSILEMTLTAMLAGTGVKLSFLRILRLARVARVLRLMKAWKGLYKIVMTVVRAMPQMSNVFILLFLVTMIFALLGMQIFGGQFNEAHGYGEEDEGFAPLPRYHFDYFVPAMLTCFIVTTGAWYAPMLEGVNVIGPGAVFFFLVVVIIGTYVMMNLLVTVLLQLFATGGDDEAEESEIKSKIRSRPSSPDSIASRPGSRMGSRASSPVPFEDRKGSRLSAEEAEDRRRIRASHEENLSHLDHDAPAVLAPDDLALGCLPPNNEFRMRCKQIVEHPSTDTLLMMSVIISSSLLIWESPRLEKGSALAINLKMFNVFFTFIFLCEAVLKVVAYGFYFMPGAYLRNGWNVLDFIILLVSLGAVLSELIPQLSFFKPIRSLRVLRPLRLLSRNDGMKLVIDSLCEAMPAVSNVFGVLLALQAVFAILGMQLFMGTFAACTDPAVSDPEHCYGVFGVPSPMPFPPPSPPPRAPVPMRPPTPPFPTNLPVPAASPLPLAVTPMQNSSIPISSDGMAISQPEARVRRMYQKADSLRRRGRHLKGGGGGASLGEDIRVWGNPEFGSFDDFNSAMLVLMIMSTGDGWDDIMFWAMDSAEEGEKRIRRDSAPVCIFFVAWMFVGCFFAMQLFVGVVVDQFNDIKAHKDGSATMTPAQMQWVETMKSMGNAKVNVRPKAGEGCVDQFLFRILTHRYYKTVMTLAVGMNVIVLATDYWGFEQPEHQGVASSTNSSTNSWYTTSLHRQFISTFSMLFYAEMFIKIKTFGLSYYLGDDWTRFEGLLVIISLVCQTSLLESISETVVELPLPIIRLPHALMSIRALRLVQHAKGMQGLVLTTIQSLPALFNVIALLLLVVFVYSVAGVQLFTFVRRGGEYTEDRNFDDFYKAALLNFQCLTGDGWSALMTQALADEDNPGSAYAVPFFVSFQILCSSVILNLVVAVILENFTSLGGDSHLVSKEDVNMFTEVWGDFDPDANLTIPVCVLPDLLKAIPQPVGLEGAPRAWVVRVCLNLGLTANKDFELGFRPVLNTLVRFNFQQQMRDELPPPTSEKAKTVMQDGDENTHVPKATVGSSMLYEGGVTLEKRRVAQHFAIELLKLSVGTSEFMRVSLLPRSERMEELTRIRNMSAQERAAAKAAAALQATMQELAGSKNASPNASFTSPDGQFSSQLSTSPELPTDEPARAPLNEGDHSRSEVSNLNDDAANTPRQVEIYANSPRVEARAHENEASLFDQPGDGISTEPRAEAHAMASEAIGSDSLAVAAASLGWTAHVAPGGHVYYHSMATGVTTWDPPPMIGTCPELSNDPNTMLATRAALCDHSLPSDATPFADKLPEIHSLEGHATLPQALLNAEEAQAAAEAARAERIMSDTKAAAEARAAADAIKAAAEARAAAEAKAEEESRAVALRVAHENAAAVALAEARAQAAANEKAAQEQAALRSAQKAALEAQRARKHAEATLAAARQRATPEGSIYSISPISVKAPHSPDPFLERLSQAEKRDLASMSCGSATGTGHGLLQLGRPATPQSQISSSNRSYSRFIELGGSGETPGGAAPDDPSRRRRRSPGERGQRVGQ